MRDLEEVHMLLNVVEKALGHPKLKPIFDQAMTALEQHAASIVSKPVEVEEAQTTTEDEEVEETETKPDRREV